MAWRPSTPLVKGMEDHRDDLVVILAGYSREMEEFLTANSGLRSRFPNIIEFPDYTAGELLEITKSIVRGKGYRLAPACDAAAAGLLPSSSSSWAIPAPMATAVWPGTRWRRPSSPAPAGMSARLRRSGTWSFCCRRTLDLKRQEPPRERRVYEKPVSYIQRLE